MRVFHRMLPALSAMAIAIPVGAHAQAVASFDGTYNGVSNTASGGGTRCFASIPVPRPITIKNGAVSWAGGMTGDIPFQGTVTAQGGVTARSSTGVVFTGKIEGGKLSGGSNSGASCTIMSVWQKS